MPILSNPKFDEELHMYLALFDYIVSVVLFQHIRDKEQRFVYYVSKAMVDIETQYSQVEQTAFALKNAAQKLRLYF